MNTLRASRQALRLALMMALGLLLAVTMTITGSATLPAHAAGSATPSAQAAWNPPPPIPDDKCGTKWDRVWIPRDDYSGYLIDGNVIGQETWYYTKGATTVTVVIKNNFDPDKTFTFSFGTEPDSTCVEAPNTVQLAATGCDPETGRTRGVVALNNTLDNTTWPLPSGAVVDLRRWDDQSRWLVNYPSEIPDGGSASVASISDSDVGAGVNGFSHMMPGTYEVSLETEDSPRTKLPQTVFVPDLCGRLGIPPGDPSGLGGPITKGGGGGKGDPGAGDDGGKGGANFGKFLPRVKVKRVGCTVKVVLKNRLGAAPVRFRVVLNPAHGKTTRYRPLVKANRKRVIKRHHFATPGRAKVVYKMAGKKHVKQKRLVRCSR